jgi:membrane protein DedA with SNARE-associated domain
MLQEEIRQLISAYGYGVIAGIVGLEGMGIPVPGETALVAAAIYAGMTDQLDIRYVIGAAACGAIVGDNCGYWLGRRIGQQALERYGHYIFLTRSRIELGQYLFVRHGGKVVFFARFFTVLRTLGAFLAGLNHMRWRRFAPFNATGSITWAAAFGLAAYLLGDQAQRLTAPLDVAGIVIVIVIALAAGALIALRRRERRWRQLARAHYDKALPPSARNS